jgi:succinate-semialdehyde dehydrogenase / glutarate-semialdehyde dehydrogenase
VRLRDQALLKQQCYINGGWVDAAGGAVLRVVNPATGSVLAHVPDAGGAETRRAIDAAHRAFSTWRKFTAEHRADVLLRWYALVVSHQDDLAQILTSEQGKPLSEARAEIAYAASYIQWFAEEGRRVYGDTIPSPWTDRRIVVTREPIGVCAAITPWNFPAAMITRKVAPALAAGCTMIVKPAPQTPLTALAFAELAARAGAPAGVVNVLTGDAQTIGRTLTESPIVRKVSFTGSTQVGRLIAAQCAPTLKRMSLELGGNAPFIVFDDANLDQAVEGALAAKFRNAGQTCVCANRFLIQSEVFEAFASKLTAAINRLTVGNGMDAGVCLGPLIDVAALQKIEELIADAVAKGARMLAGGHRHALGGTYYQPTVLANVDVNMRIAHEEIFGPIAPLFRFDDEAQAIALANDSSYGLAAYFYTNDVRRVWRVSEALEYGMVGINSGVISTAVAPFGGIKQSGMGREGSFLGIDEYLEAKYLCVAM